MAVDSKNTPTESNLSLVDLRNIIFGLKMSEFPEMEESVANEVRFAVQDLPSAEELLQFADSPEGLQSVRSNIGAIMKVIEQHTRRDLDSKARHEAKKGFPPRYKVLNWTKNMTKSNIIKNLIKISSDLDNDHQGKLASEFLKVAEFYNENKSSEEDVAVFLKEAGFEVESQGIRDWWNRRKERNQIEKSRRKNVKDLSALKKQRTNQLLVSEQKIKNAIDFLNRFVNSMGEFSHYFNSSLTTDINESINALAQNMKLLQQEIVFTKTQMSQDIYNWEGQEGQEEQEDWEEAETELEQVAPQQVAPQQATSAPVFDSQGKPGSTPMIGEQGVFGTPDAPQLGTPDSSQQNIKTSPMIGEQGVFGTPDAPQLPVKERGGKFDEEISQIRNDDIRKYLTKMVKDITDNPWTKDSYQYHMPSLKEKMINNGIDPSIVDRILAEQSSYDITDQVPATGSPQQPSYDVKKTAPPTSRSSFNLNKSISKQG